MRGRFICTTVTRKLDSNLKIELRPRGWLGPNSQIGNSFFASDHSDKFKVTKDKVLELVVRTASGAVIWQSSTLTGDRSTDPATRSR